MQSIECVLVHVPKLLNYYPSINYYTSVNTMCMGLLAFADNLENVGIRTKVLHLGVQMSLDNDFSLKEFVKKHGIKIVCFSLHWHHQLTDTLQQAKLLKENNEDIVTVFGGFTASFFRKELLENYPFVDFIIRGDGDKPLPTLAKSILNGKNDLSTIPNLSWRSKDRIIENLEWYSASQEDLDATNFDNLDLLEHYHEYINYPKTVMVTKLPRTLNYKLSKMVPGNKSRTYWGIIIGRGCLVNCAYCGGGARAHKLINKRRNVVFRSPEKVIRSFITLQSYGISQFGISFDPVTLSEKYYLQLFALMRKENIKPDVTFSSWGLPSKEFCKSFKETCGANSTINISPETGLYEARKKVRGFHFSNIDFYEILDYCENNKIKTNIFFSLGPSNTEINEWNATIEMKNRIRQNYRWASILGFLVEMEPAAAYYFNPDKYGIKNLRVTLNEFIAQQSDPAYSSMTKLGYLKRTLLGEPIKNNLDFEQKLLKMKNDYLNDRKVTERILEWVWKVINSLNLTYG